MSARLSLITLSLVGFTLGCSNTADVDGDEGQEQEIVGLGTSSGPDAPTILSLNVTATQITEGDTLGFQFRMSDPDGVSDISGGRLLSADGMYEYATIPKGDAEGLFVGSVTWDELNMYEDITFDATGTRDVLVEFTDASGGVASYPYTINLFCYNESAACGGECNIDLMSDPGNCGMCGEVCSWCDEGTCPDMDVPLLHTEVVGHITDISLTDLVVLGTSNGTVFAQEKGTQKAAGIQIYDPEAAVMPGDLIQVDGVFRRDAHQPYVDASGEDGMVEVTSSGEIIEPVILDVANVNKASSTGEYMGMLTRVEDATQFMSVGARGWNSWRLMGDEEDVTIDDAFFDSLGVLDRGTVMLWVQGVLLETGKIAPRDEMDAMIHPNPPPPPICDITLALTTDFYPSEMTWYIENSVGTEVASGGPYSSSNTTYNTLEQLPSGDYTAYMFDSWGDGWSSGGLVISSSISGQLASGSVSGNSNTMNFTIPSGC